MPILKNPKQERFAQEIAKGTDATEAYRIAGFHGTPGNARRLKQKEAIRERVGAILQKRNHIEEAATKKAIEKLAITKERVLEELARIGFGNIADYVDVTGDSPIIHLQDVPRDKLAALSEITTETFVEKKGSDGEPTSVRRVKLKLWDKRGALNDLGKHLGMFRDKVEISGTDNGPIAFVTDEDRAKALAAFLAKARHAG